jgi:hypothetical protein
MQATFTPFVIDVVDAVAAEDSEEAALDALRDRFAHWRNLLSGGPHGLSAIKLRGLFGELWTAHHLLAPRLGAAAAIASWTGPDRARRDFLFGGLGIEVKTTTSAPPASVRIQSELQLDVAPLDTLLLVAIELDASSGVSGMSVVDIVERISAASGDTVPLFAQALLAYGYHPVHKAVYADHRFVVRQVRLYRIENGFPRIVPTSLHAGVGRVAYDLSLGACEPWRLDEGSFESLLAPATGSD